MFKIEFLQVPGVGKGLFQYVLYLRLGSSISTNSLVLRKIIFNSIHILNDNQWVDTDVAHLLCLLCLILEAELTTNHLQVHLKV